MSETQNSNSDVAPLSSGLQTLAELNMESLQSRIATVPSLQEQWGALRGSARLRLAGCPFLLVDAGFAQPELWASIPNFGVHETRPVRTLLATRSALSTPLVRGCCCWPGTWRARTGRARASPLA